MLQEVLDQIRLYPFKINKHMKLLQEMLESNSYKDDIQNSYIPKIGYICLLGDQPLAAGFLRRVECDVVAQIDGLTSNKAFGSILRHQAIDMIVDQLIIEAKALEIQGLMAFTHDEGVLKRAKNRGFNILGEKLISISFK